MAATHRVYVGTIGEGIWRSVDGGESFARAADGMFVECHVRALVVHPEKPNVLYLGSEQGLFRTTDGADNWQCLPAPLQGLQVWSILVHPRDPDLIVVGTCPPHVFRSADGGRTWSEGRAAMKADCPRILHNRVTTVAADPDDPTLLWAGVEIDGLYRSRDAGIHWEAAGTGLSSRDIHDLVFIPGPGGTTMLAATNNDLNASTDGGHSWQPLRLHERLPWPYYRRLAQPSGRPRTLLLGTGNGPPGSAGTVARSLDGGSTWQALPLGDSPGDSLANSTMWNFAVHKANPALLYASSVSGQLYRSLDHGETWNKCPREFGEIRALAWAPNI